MSFYDSFIETAPALLVAIPLLIAFMTPIMSKISSNLRKVWNILGIIIVAAVMLVLGFEVLSGGGAVSSVYVFGGREGTLFPLPGGNVARITFYVDGMSAFMGLLMTVVAFGSLIYSLSFMKRYTGLDKYYTLLFLMLAANLGMVFTGDLFNLFVWFEISAVAICALTAYRTERGESFEGAIKYLVYSTIAGLLLLFSIGILYGQYGHLNIVYLSKAIGGHSEMLVMDKLVLGILVTVFALKAGSVPMHMATTDAYSEAPAPITAMMVTASQAGLYALFRSVFTMYGANIQITQATVNTAGWVVVILGIMAMFVGVTMALVQKDIKRLMAYCAISQTGFMLLGVGVGMAVYNTPEFLEFGRIAMSGGIFHIFNDAIYMGLLFMTAGAIIYKTGTRDLNKMGGLGRDMWLTAIFFIIGALAISGIPPMNGFSSKLLMYESVFKFSPVIGAIAMLVSLLTLAIFVKVFYSAFMGPRNKDMKRGEVPTTMLLGMALLGSVILVFSLFPGLVVRTLVDPAVNALTGVEGTTGTSLTLFTGEGSWNAIVLVAAFAVALVVSLLIRSLGHRGTTPKGEGAKPYLFGNPTEIDGKPLTVTGSNLYWGFTKALSRYYRPTEGAHSGLLNEYIFYLIAALVIVMAVMVFL